MYQELKADCHWSVVGKQQKHVTWKEDALYFDFYPVMFYSPQSN